MADYTQYKKLELPKTIEHYDVGVVNKNNRIIDSELHKLDLKNQNQDNLFNTHIDNKNNPHGVTKTQIGLSNVENKSSSTIRDEITKNNVTKALGYTPYTPNEVDNKFSALETKIDWKESVDTFDDISMTYPNPEDGWTVNTKDTDYTYRYNGDKWVVISANAIPKVTSNVDGLLSKEDYVKYEDANNKKHSHTNKSVLDGITSALLTAWNNAVEHITDTIKHITSEERTNWNVAKTHADSQHARVDATKVEKSNTNGNIKINGAETIVYIPNDFILINQQILTFSNNVCTISDERITADSLAYVIFTSDTISVAEKADISVETYNGNVKLTASNLPTGTIKATIHIRVV